MGLGVVEGGGEVFGHVAYAEGGHFGCAGGYEGFWCFYFDVERGLSVERRCRRDAWRGEVC